MTEEYKDIDVVYVKEVLANYGIYHSYEAVLYNCYNGKPNSRIFIDQIVEGKDEDIFIKYLANVYNLIDYENMSDFVRIVSKSDELVTDKFDILDELGTEKEITDHIDDVEKIKFILKERGIKHTKLVVLNNWKEISNMLFVNWLPLEGLLDNHIYQIYRAYDVNIVKDIDEMMKFLSIIRYLKYGGIEKDEVEFKMSNMETVIEVLNVENWKDIFYN
ncbi:MAG: hypothetical protein N4A40_13235 [Tissierellales bacterium]|jgi:hypothetical protein|nr:hypothetical protein [Tissierellales bacterium]